MQNSDGRLALRTVWCVLVSLLANQSCSPSPAKGWSVKSSGPLGDSAHHNDICHCLNT